MEGPLADRTLVLVPPGRSRPRGLQRRLEGLPVEWQEATGQDLLLDSHLQEPPVDTIGRIAEWLAGAVDAEPTTVARPIDSSVAVERTALGQPVIERSVSLGPLGLFGIVTESEVAPATPTIVLVNEGNTHHIGQSRIWVDLARRLGHRGLPGAPLRPQRQRGQRHPAGPAGPRGPRTRSHRRREPGREGDLGGRPGRRGADRLLLGGLPDRRAGAGPSDRGECA